jgi:hypothetical protein
MNTTSAGLAGHTSRRGLLKLAAAGSAALAAAAIPSIAEASSPTEDRTLVVYWPGVDGLEPGDVLGVRRSDGKLEKLATDYCAGVHAFAKQRGRPGARLIPVVVAGITKVKAERLNAGVPDSGPIPGLKLGSRGGVARLGGSGIGIVLERLESDTGYIHILISGS